MLRPRLPTIVVATVGVIAPATLLISVSVNIRHLYHLGEEIGYEWLAWTMPVAVVTYEMVSSLVYFMSPPEFRDIRRSALIGAVLGWVATNALGALSQALEDRAIFITLTYKILLVPVPSAIAALFLHMLALVVRAVRAAKEWQHAAAAAVSLAAAEADSIPAAAPEAADSGSTPETLPKAAAVSLAAAEKPAAAAGNSSIPAAPQTAADSGSIISAADGGSVSVVADSGSSSTPAASSAADSGSAEERQQDGAAVLPFVQDPAARRRHRQRQQRSSLPRVAEEHVQKVLPYLREVQKDNGDIYAVRATDVEHLFSEASIRTVRAALQVARQRLEDERQRAAAEDSGSAEERQQDGAAAVV